MAENNLAYHGESKDVFEITAGPYAGKYSISPKIPADKVASAIVNGIRTHEIEGIVPGILVIFDF